jgi:type VI secretion system protein ImpF
MPPIRSDQPLVPSILDRLLDEEPSNHREAPKSRVQVLRELKQSVRRDLENLLNTRCRSMPRPTNLTELEVSLAGYGLPDISGAELTSTAGRERFRRTVERIIRTFEPRFKSVAVTLVDAGSAVDRTLRFRIDGLLKAEPAPEPVAFDSAIEATTGNVEIRGTTA